MKKALYCATCKLDNMIDIRSAKCIICNLKDGGYNYPNEKQRIYCKYCKRCGMVDVKNKKCISCHLKQPNSPTEKKR